MEAQWTSNTGQRVSVPLSGDPIADRSALLRSMPDLLADLRPTGQFLRTLKEMSDKQMRIERQ